MRSLIALAFIAGAEWFENKSRWAGVEACEESADEYAAESISEDQSREEFEEVAAVRWPEAMGRGVNPTHGTYNDSNLEKRWRGWRARDEFLTTRTITARKSS